MKDFERITRLEGEYLKLKTEFEQFHYNFAESLVIQGKNIVAIERFSKNLKTFQTSLSDVMKQNIQLINEVKSMNQQLIKLGNKVNMMWWVWKSGN